MQLRSGVVRKLFLANQSSSPFSTPRAVSGRETSTSEQKRVQDDRITKNKVAESIEALSQCCQMTRKKVERNRKAIECAELNHTKFSVHELKLYLKTVGSAYDEYNELQNRIYLTDPTRKAEFEVHFTDFEEHYEFVRFALSEIIAKYEDEQKAAAEAAAIAREQQILEMETFGGTSSQSYGSGGELTVVPRMTPSPLLHQTPVPTFDGSYEN